jgi:hypothetical protein
LGARKPDDLRGPTMLGAKFWIEIGVCLLAMSVLLCLLLTLAGLPTCW